MTNGGESIMTFAEIEEVLLRFLPQKDCIAAEAAHYAVLGGGKRLRFLIAAATAQLLGTEVDDNILRIAAATEMLHAYSLIHDDLPCMDNDDFRRGKPSCHKAFGEANAVLAGDLLQTAAAQTLVGGIFHKGYRSGIEYLLDKGARGIIKGQCMDIAAAQTTRQYIIETAIFKTAAMFCAPAVAVALYLENTKAVAVLEQFFTHFGICFQITDDIADKETDKFGFLCLGVAEAADIRRSGLEQCRLLLNQLPKPAKFFTELVEKHC